MLLPNLVNVWNVFVLRNFFNTIPEELKEAATIDGASQGRIFRMIVLPLSKPALATISIYYAVAHWNSWFDIGASSFRFFKEIFSWFEIHEDCALIWRPHPMTEVLCRAH
jgi:ABC-type sugar transport system permease subunit